MPNSNSFDILISIESDRAFLINKTINLCFYKDLFKPNQNLSNFNIDLNFNTATKLDNPLLNYWVKKLPDRLVSVNEKVEGGRSITIGKKDIKNNKLNNFTTVLKSDNPYEKLKKIPNNVLNSTQAKLNLIQKLDQILPDDWEVWS